MTKDRYWEIAWEIFPQSGVVQGIRETSIPIVEELKRIPKKIGDEELHEKVAQLFSLLPEKQESDKTIKFPKTMHNIGSLGAGGAERQLVNLLVELDNMGHKDQSLLTVYPLEGSGGHYAPLLTEHNVKLIVNNIPIRDEGIEIIRNNFEKVQAIKAMPFSFNAWVMDLWVEIELEKPDVFHAWLDHCSLWGGIAAVIAEVPTIVLSTRNVNPSNFPYLYSEYMQPWYRWLMACPRVRMLNNSSPGADSYAQWLEYDRSKIDVVLNGVNLDHLKPATPEERNKIRTELGIPLDAVVVVGAFRLSEEKRPEMFVETFAKAREKHPDIYGVLMGEGPYIEQVNAAVEKYDLKDCFFAIGRRTDLPLVMTSMDVFLHTAFWEGTPNVVLEAQQMGLPVVVTDSGGTIHAVDNGESGIMVEKNDIEGLVNALVKVISEIAEWKEKAKNSHKFIKERFGVARMVEETLLVQRGEYVDDYKNMFWRNLIRNMKSLFSN